MRRTNSNGIVGWLIELAQYTFTIALGSLFVALALWIFGGCK